MASSSLHFPTFYRIFWMNGAGCCLTREHVGFLARKTHAHFRTISSHHRQVATRPGRPKWQKSGEIPMSGSNTTANTNCDDSSTEDDAPRIRTRRRTRHPDATSHETSQLVLKAAWMTAFYGDIEIEAIVSLSRTSCI